jgi:hypothetical protein
MGTGGYLRQVDVYSRVKCEDEEHKHYTVTSGESDRLLQSYEIPVLSSSLLSVVGTEYHTRDSYSDSGLTV